VLLVLGRIGMLGAWNAKGASAEDGFDEIVWAQRTNGRVGEDDRAHGYREWRELGNAMEADDNSNDKSRS
jgi:hypothetical protein